MGVTRCSHIESVYRSGHLFIPYLAHINIGDKTSDMEETLGNIYIEFDLTAAPRGDQIYVAGLNQEQQQAMMLKVSDEALSLYLMKRVRGEVIEEHLEGA